MGDARRKWLRRAISVERKGGVTTPEGAAEASRFRYKSKLAYYCVIARELIRVADFRKREAALRGARRKGRAAAR